MSQNTNHPSLELLLAYVDGVMTVAERRDIETHVHGCVACMRAVSSMRRIDSSIRTLPLERTRRDFTSSVMNRIGILGPTPFMFRLLENSAYIFGLFIVLAIMLAAFVLTGIIDWGQVQQSQSTASGIWTEIAGGTSAAIQMSSEWLRTFLPFIFGKGALSIAILAAGVLGLLAAVDRFFERRLSGKSR